MRIIVGSKNETKIGAVREVFHASEIFRDVEIVGVDPQVPEYGHPKSLDEVIAGACGRAKNVFAACNYSVGIEGGLMAASMTKTGYVEVAVCAIFDGKNFHLGLSPGYEWPPVILDAILNQGLDGSQALREAGFTQEEKIGAGKGGVFLLTNGQMDRTAYNKAAVQMAFVHLQHPEWYEKNVSV